WVSDLAAGAAEDVAAASLARPGDLRLLNKSDLAAGARPQTPPGIEVQVTSARDPAETDRIRILLTQTVVERASGAFPAGTRQRHASALQAALGHVNRALAEAEPELAAEDVRLATRALDSITGRIGAEEVLGRVFATFCIGK
ncbi:MAG TPA: tRNA uridine-5-carboxymethylaminomethyl(34) synthesis GTPase MnmE, partial [Phenylobacterium sp.]|nr:tRNA uridine-5-carboxymethylaminomethyl(34) synthesis GTPase MnmE [Phenylobacterium sp.]